MTKLDLSEILWLFKQNKKTHVDCLNAVDAYTDELPTTWTPITGEASLPKDDEALCVLARYTSKGELRTTPAEKFGLLKSMFPMDEFQFYTILQPPVK